MKLQVATSDVSWKNLISLGSECWLFIVPKLVSRLCTCTLLYMFGKAVR
jgi:hypothetical protein